jgi:hypothetical protein
MSVKRAGGAAGRRGDDDLGGVRAVLAETASAIRDTPELILLFLVVAPLSNIPILGGIITIVGHGLGIVFVAERLETTRTRGDDSLGIRLIVLFVNGLIVVAAVIVGLIMLVVPGLYLWARFYLAPPAILIDHEGPVEALGESWSRTAGNTVTVFLVAGSIAVLTLVVAAVVLLAVAGGPDAAIDRITSDRTFVSRTVAGLIGSVLMVAASTVIYGRTEPDTVRP